MKKLQTIEQLKKSILVFSVSSIIVVGALVASAVLYPLSQQLKEHAARNLLDAAKSRKIAIVGFFSKLEQTAWQITSRTKAREKLEQYNPKFLSCVSLKGFKSSVIVYNGISYIN